MRNPEPDSRAYTATYSLLRSWRLFEAAKIYNRAAKNPGVIKSIPLQSAGGQLYLAILRS